MFFCQFVKSTKFCFSLFNPNALRKAKILASLSAIGLKKMDVYPFTFKRINFTFHDQTTFMGHVVMCAMTHG